MLNESNTARGGLRLAASHSAGAARCWPSAGSRAQAWEPTKPVQFIIPAGTGGGADQMARFIQGVVAKNNLMKQPLITVNKGGGAGAEGFLEVKKAQRRPPQHHHHAVQPVHHALWHRRAVQLEGPDAGRHAGARPVRPVGAGRHALQDRQGLHRGGQGRRRQDLQDGRHRLQAGGPDHHGGAGEADGAQEVHLRALRRRRHGRHAAGRQARQLEREQPDRGGLAVEGRRAAGRCASSTPSAASTRSKVTADMAWSDIPTCKEVGRRHASTRCCAASSCRPASSPSRSPSTSTCSRR